MNGTKESQKNQKPVQNVEAHIGIEKGKRKYCSKCKKNKELGKFHKNRAKKDGVATICKLCTKLVYKNKMEKFLKYYMLEGEPHPCHKRKNKKSMEHYEKIKRTREYKIHRAKSLKKYREKHPLKYKCAKIFHNSIRKGIINVKPCFICGTFDNLEAHHEDYTKPIDVIWLCKYHHKELHFKNSFHKRLKSGTN